MQIEERVVDGVTILDLKGKMTLGEGDELLKDKINSLIQQDRKKLLLNLEGVPYIDSAGLGEIVRTYTTVSRQGGKLKLLNLTKRIQDLLAITKLLTVFETYESEPDATPLQELRGLRRGRHPPRSGWRDIQLRTSSSGSILSRRRGRDRRRCSYCPCARRSGRRTSSSSLGSSSASGCWTCRRCSRPGRLRDLLRAVGRRLPDQRRRRSRGRPPASGQEAPADRLGRGAGAAALTLRRRPRGRRACGRVLVAADVRPARRRRMSRCWRCTQACSSTS